jgi:hypothetical protein
LRVDHRELDYLRRADIDRYLDASSARSCVGCGARTAA